MKLNEMGFFEVISFLLVHMFRYEVVLMLAIVALAAWRLSTVLAKHNARYLETRLAQRLSWGCLLTIVVLVVSRYFLL